MLNESGPVLITAELDNVSKNILGAALVAFYRCRHNVKPTFNSHLRDLLVRNSSKRGLLRVTFGATAVSSLRPWFKACWNKVSA